ncbi:MAG TPA: sigma factor-like helix-turn-helix DNA-binding protein [Terracidiphilus sp.]|nr:sigma factor-like helix-turn-helix DNA-binding protein [Terracidiphilus sp.]
MSEERTTAQGSLIPPQPIPEGAQAFSKRVHSLLDGSPKDDATVAKALDGMDEMFDRIAAGLYSLASMLVGEGEESVRLVEKTVATTEVSPCDDPVEARKRCRLALCMAALETIARRDAGSLAAPQGLAQAGGCIEDDDLESAGVSREELERMIAGPNRDRVRQWLAQLPTELRTIFVLRAVAGFTAAETARLLAEHGGAQAAGWTAEAVRELFRQALCSLASQLIQNSAAR